MRLIVTPLTLREQNPVLPLFPAICRPGWAMLHHQPDATERRCPAMRTGLKPADGRREDQNMIVFFLAEDPQTGLIVDGAYLSGGPGIFASTRKRKEYARWRSRDICKGYGLHFKDSDGPYFKTPWRSPSPRWSSGRPSQFSESRWATRLRSVDDLEAYRTQMAADPARPPLRR
jgi:hypothetical protein